MDEVIKVALVRQPEAVTWEEPVEAPRVPESQTGTGESAVRAH